MRLILSIGLFFVAFSNASIAQLTKKNILNKLDKTYLAFTTNIFMGNNNGFNTADKQIFSSIGYAVDIMQEVGRNNMVGIGFSKIAFNEENKVLVLNTYLEKNYTKGNRKLFVFAKPGLAFAKNKQQQIANISNLEYYKAKPGLNLQFGYGIKWLTGRHNCNLSASYNITKYNLLAKEYPQPFDPYDPFFEPYILHTYKLNFQKFMLNFGITL